MMADMAIHRIHFLRLYELLERDKTAKQEYLKEWDTLIAEERTLENLLENELGDYTPEEDPGGDHAEPQEIPPKTVDLKTPDWICRCGIDCKQMRHLVQAMQQCGIYHRQHDTANQKKGMSNEPFRHSKIS